jgi:hypothetical protein
VNKQTDPVERRPRLVSIGILLTGLGGALLAAALVVTLPAGVVVGAVGLFVAGLVVVGLGGGLKVVWEVAKSLFP